MLHRLLKRRGFHGLVSAGSKLGPKAENQQSWQPLQYCKDKEAEATLFNHIDMHSILLLPFQPSRAAPADCLKHSFAECLHILEASRKDWSKCPVMRKESGLALPLSLLRGIIMNWALELFDGAFAPGCCM